jgi:hypothetical protein
MSVMDLPHSQATHGMYREETGQMHSFQRTYRGFSLMVEVNSDRILFLGAITGALLLGAYLGGL